MRSGALRQSRVVRFLVRSTLLGVVFMLAACAPVRLREDAAGLAAQAARESSFATQDRWSLTARLAVSNGEEGGNGELTWKQDGDAFDFTVHAPVTGKTWRLHGDARGAMLEGVRETALSGSDANELLRSETGWSVPMAELRYWVRALRAPGGRAQLVFDAQGLPAELTQGGWKVEYRDWMQGAEPALPRKVFATRGKARVRLVVEQWQAP
jgi:outer membrane lipoprotein LolB